MVSGSVEGGGPRKMCIRDRALSDADALIESLEQLLVKKRHLKQGAMQELLTGMRRLPGFSGAWETKNLDEVCWFQEGPGVRNTQFTSCLLYTSRCV